MIIVILIFLFLPTLTWAETITWDCRTERDIQAYRDERSTDNGQTWGVMGTVAHVPGCKTLSLTNPNVVTPGVKLHRVFAINTSGNDSPPSAVISVTIKPSPIGNTGGQTEPTLPPSPYKPTAPPPVLPDPVIMLPLPPIVVKPWPTIGPVTGFQAINIMPTSATITFLEPVDSTGATVKSDIRVSMAPMVWGGSTSVSCMAGVCQLFGLSPDTLMQVQGVGYVPVPNQLSRFGAISDVYTFRTAKLPVAPPPPSVTLKDALLSGLDTCLTNGLAHTACLKALREAIGKVTQ